MLLSVLNIISWMVFYYKFKEKRVKINYIHSVIYTIILMNIGFLSNFLIIPIFHILLCGLLVYFALRPLRYLFL